MSFIYESIRKEEGSNCLKQQFIFEEKIAAANSFHVVGAHGLEILTHSLSKEYKIC